MNIDALPISSINDIIERYKKGEYLTRIAHYYGFSIKDGRRLLYRLARERPNWPEVARARTAARLARRAEIEEEKTRRAATRARRAQYVKAPPRLPPEERKRKSFEGDVTGEETLFCDTEFLESFFKRPVKRAAECTPRNPPGEEITTAPGHEDQDSQESKGRKE